MVVAIVGTVLGVGLFGFIVAKVTGVIRAWIERDKGVYNEEAFQRLAKAFMEHKKNTERRLQNVEAIIADEDSGSEAGTDSKQLSEPHKTIEIEDEHDENRENERSGGGNLQNMLKN